MKEQVAEIIQKHGATVHSEYVTMKILNLFKAEVDKLTVIDDEEIDKKYIEAWAKRNTGVDSPLELKLSDGDEEIDVLRELQEAQLQHDKQILLDLMGE